MKDILLLIGFLTIAIFLFFVMTRYDKFLCNIRKANAEETKPYVVLRRNTTNIETDKEIENYRRQHPNAAVVICTPAEVIPPLSQSSEEHPKREHKNGKERHENK